MASSRGWRAVSTTDGSVTFESPLHGQLCHSKAGAWTEAEERYVRPCRIEERCIEFAKEGRPLRLLDIGTGVGWNLSAAWRALDRARAVEPDATLEIWTFEAAVGVLEASLAAGLAVDTEAESYHARWRDILEEIAVGGFRATPVRRRGTSLRLYLGDARTTLANIPTDILFDACFFDAFSPGVDPPLWAADFLRAVGDRLAPGAILSTYTASLEVRARLVFDARLQVGRGPRACGKSQGTLAIRPPGPPPEPFDARTARKLEARLRRKAVESPGFSPSTSK